MEKDRMEKEKNMLKIILKIRKQNIKMMNYFLKENI